MVQTATTASPKEQILEYCRGHGWSKQEIVQHLQDTLRAEDIAHARIDKVTWKLGKRHDRIVINYSLPTRDIDAEGATILDDAERKEFTINDRERARSKFYQALEAFIPYLGTFIEMPCKEFTAENTKITAVGFPVNDAYDEGLYLVAQKTLTVGLVWNIVTPTWWAQPVGGGDDFTRVYPEALEDLVTHNETSPTC